MIAADLKKIMPLASPANVEQYAPHLNAACMRYGIAGHPRQCAFLATVAVESGQLRSVSENLNYSAQGLMKTWPNRFSSMDAAEPYHREPEKIANRVYAGRMGNGNEQSGDGWRYRGAGLIQLTGKDNQLACAREFGIDPATIGDWLRTPEGASWSAAWFWRRSGCNELADKKDLAGVRKRINGGLIGFDEFKLFYLTADKALPK